MTVAAKLIPANRALIAPCGRCGSKPWLVHEILDVKTGGTLRMFRCICGEQIWHHDKE
jgi:hypothetical protein